MVNPLVKSPSPPGAWVDEERCVCGATYRAFRLGWNFSDALLGLQQETEDSAMYRTRGYGTFISRGPVLWYWRTAKLAAFYEEHSPCGVYGMSLGQLDCICDDLDMDVTVQDIDDAGGMFSAYLERLALVAEYATCYAPVPF